MQNDFYIWEATVRDYELDGQKIVNNATYVNYFEQCRSDYVRSLGVSFEDYHLAGYDFVVAGIEIEYRHPLCAQNEFYVTAKITHYDEKRVYFEQEIKRKSDDKLVAKAKVRVACIDRSTWRSCMPEMLKNKLDSLKQ